MADEHQGGRSEPFNARGTPAQKAAGRDAVSVRFEYDRFVETTIKISRGTKYVELTLPPASPSLPCSRMDRVDPTVATATRHSSLSAALARCRYVAALR